ncbi:MAG TPA: hypothetical protein VK277_14370 [Acidimicrobiales bacterium]|nr:hypothetical protein [Acidimicrobiales bacterium]
MGERLSKTRDATTKRLLKIGVVRRWYARRMLKYIEKTKKKKRPLPDELVRLDQLTRKMPEPQKLKLIEEMLTPGKTDQLGRELRRAAERQNRESGRGPGGRRPGMPPQRQVVRRPTKGAR